MVQARFLLLWRVSVHSGLLVTLVGLVLSGAAASAVLPGAPLSLKPLAAEGYAGIALLLIPLLLCSLYYVVPRAVTMWRLAISGVRTVAVVNGSELLALPPEHGGALLDVRHFPRLIRFAFTFVDHSGRTRMGEGRLKTYGFGPAHTAEVVYDPLKPERSMFLETLAPVLPN